MGHEATHRNVPFGRTAGFEGRSRGLPTLLDIVATRRLDGTVLATVVFTGLLALCGCSGLQDRNGPASMDPYALEIRDQPTECPLVTLPLASGESFTIRYIHSVDGTPVFEVFEVGPEGRLTLQSTYFKMFGAGMGTIEGRGTLDFDGEWTWIRDIHEPLNAFILRVGSPGVDHTLLYRGREIPLSARWAGKRVLVDVVRRSP